ncbi:hypothetical protein ACIBF1_07840 [Spirillospora sp. NPDC050679]
MAGIQARHPRVELYLHQPLPGEPLILKVIRTRPVFRGRGLAAAALREMVALAEELQVPVRLVAEPIAGDTDTRLLRLIAWWGLPLAWSGTAAGSGWISA